MNRFRLALLGVTGSVLLSCPNTTLAQQGVADFDPVGKYTVEATLAGTPLEAVLAVVRDDQSLFARFMIPGQPTLVLGTAAVVERTVTLADQVAAVEVSFVLEFETDSTFTGTWATGPDGGTITGRRSADPAPLSPMPPRCAGGPGELPPPLPTPRPRSDPADARIIASDVALFWQVLDSGPDPTLPERLHCDYLRRGTDAVRDFIPGRIVSGERLAETVTTHRERYEAARESSLTMAEVEPEIRAVFHQMKARYADAVFPDVYFLVGRLNTGGTISQRGLLIGAEMYTDHSDVPPIVAHELVHYQQRPIPPDQRTLLAQSIMEGSADFVAELISGRHINHGTHEYALPRERELWEEFSGVMHGDDFTGWLYGGQPEGRPADLGYFFGYRIAQSYYASAGSDQEALREILTVTDYEKFLERSGYDPSDLPGPEGGARPGGRGDQPTSKLCMTRTPLTSNGSVSCRPATRSC